MMTSLTAFTPPTPPSGDSSRGSKMPAIGYCIGSVALARTALAPWERLGILLQAQWEVRQETWTPRG